MLNNQLSLMSTEFTASKMMRKKNTDHELSDFLLRRII